MDNKEIEKLFYKAKLLGILTPIKTFCGGTCYLISKSKTDHVIIIPPDVERLNYNYNMKNGIVFTQHIKSLKGNVKVIGGDGLKDVHAMFAECTADRVDISELNTSNVKCMEYMFYGSRIKSINLEALDTSNVIHMDFMFAQSELRKVNFSNFDTHNVVSMYYMFYCSGSDELDLSSFNTHKVIEFKEMFSSCISNKIDISNFELDKEAKIRGMFKYAQAKFIIKNAELMQEYMYNNK